MISVCMAAYNGEKYIAEQISSILAQLGADDELVISDDASLDDTLNIIRSFNDERIVLIEGDVFGSPTYNFENAIKRAQGDFIFLADQDDVWLPDKVHKTLPWLEKFDLVVSDCIVVDKELNVIKKSFVDGRIRQNGLIHNLHHNPYMGCCMAFKKSVLNYVLPFPRCLALHDIWIGLSVELNGNQCFIDDKLIFFRRHGKNASPSGEKSKRSLFSKLSYRMVVILALFLRRFKMRASHLIKLANNVFGKK